MYVCTVHYILRTVRRTYNTPYLQHIYSTCALCHSDCVPDKGLVGDGEADLSATVPAAWPEPENCPQVERDIDHVWRIPEPL